MIVEINGNEYEIKYTINILCQMTTDGFDVMDISNMNINLVTVRDLFYYGLKACDKKITKNRAGDLMDEYLAEGGTFDKLIEIIMNALAKSLGNDKVDEEDVEGEEGK